MADWRDRIELHEGDTLAVLPTLAENSIDACVTDPPYHLTSIVQRFGGDDAAPAKSYKTGAYGGGFKEANGGTGAASARMSRGFMGKVWDGGDVAFDPDTWRAVFRVLKPGAHLVAFGGTRTFHRMACAIEDAGFEIRDTIMWLYGSGFPKSHDVSKGIDRAAGMDGQWLKRANGQSRGGGTIIGQHISTDGQYDYQPATDAAREWEGWGTALKPAVEPIILARKPLSEKTVAANVLRWGTGALNINACRVRAEQWDQNIDKADIGCSPGSRTVVAATSSNIDGCGSRPTDQSQTDMKSTTSTDANSTIELRTYKLFENQAIEHCTNESIGTESKTLPLGESKQSNPATDDGLILNGLNANEREAEKNITGSTPIGRWPSNLIHDGSDEVVEGFPETTSGSFSRNESDETTYQPGGWRTAARTAKDFGPANSGSAARFFYTAKADSDDRLGSKHPTVKPLDLMQYLVRLVCRRGGTVLDPFAGTGTTGEAAWREGMRAVLIEREAEYCADIRRRMALLLGGLDERAREAIKARGLVNHDPGPLFADRYDPEDDLRKSVNLCLETVRARMADGGPCWPKE